MTFGGIRAVVISASKDSLKARVPEDLPGDRTARVFADTLPRTVEALVRIARSSGDTIVVSRSQVRYIPPRLIRYDEVTGTALPLRQEIMAGSGGGFIRAFVFIGNHNDGLAALRVVNTSVSTPPNDLLTRVLSPPPKNELFDKNPNPVLLTIGNPNRLNIGNLNAGVQFPIELDGLYLIVVGAGASGDLVAPGGSHGKWRTI